jgi:hypothetical protein
MYSQRYPYKLKQLILNVQPKVSIQTKTADSECIQPKVSIQTKTADSECTAKGVHTN